MNTSVSKKIHSFLGFLIDLTVANALHLLTLKTNPMAFYRRTKNLQVWRTGILPNDAASIHLPVLHLCTPLQTRFTHFRQQPHFMFLHNVNKWRPRVKSDSKTSIPNLTLKTQIQPFSAREKVVRTFIIQILVLLRT